MKKGNIIAFLIAFYTAIFNLHALDTLILNEDEAVKIGLNQNIDLKKTLISLNTSKQQADNSWNNYLPDFTLTSKIARSEEFLTVDSTNTSTDPWSMTLYGGISFTLGFDDFVDAAADEIDLKIQQLDFETTEKILEVNIRKQFKYLLASKENLALQQSNIALAQKRYDQAKINYSNGFISELSLLTTQNSVESLKPTYQDADTTYKQNVMSFQNLLGLELGQEIELIGNLDVEYYSLNPIYLIESFLNKRLDVSSGLLDIESEKNDLASTKASELLPTLTFTTYWNNSISTLFDDPDWSDSTSISATLTIPINGFIPGSSENLSIKEDEQSVEKYELALDNTRNSAEEEIRSILMELEGAWANINTTQLSVELAQKTYEMTEESFQKGSSEILDVEDSQNTLLSTKQDLLLSKYTYLASLLDLEYAINTDITKVIKN